jgi:hypothetical protein
MMQLRQAKSRAEAANKLADDDAGDAHEKLAEVDNWDLRDHRQQSTRVQNRRNVQVGSRKNQAKSRTGTYGFLHQDNKASAVVF